MIQSAEAPVLWHILAGQVNDTVAIPAQWHWDNRRRNEPECVCIQHVETGQLILNHRGSTYHIDPGFAVLFCHGDDSDYSCDPHTALPFCSSWMVLQGAGLRAHWEYLLRHHGPVLDLRDGHLLHQLHQLLRTASAHCEPDPHLVAHLVHDFVMALCRGHLGLSRERPVHQAMARLRANPVFGWNLKALAHSCGCTREHFSRVFQRTHGLGPAQYLAQQRILLAKRLLVATALSLDDVARQAGFSGIHTLNRHLRHDCGLTPGAYRERARS